MIKSNNEFVNGFIVGTAQVLSGHPLDTLKSNMQKYKKINWDIFKRNPRQLYRGITYPLLGNGIINAIFFGLNKHFYTKYHNYYLSGAFAGFTTSFITNPIDLYKIRKQVAKKNIYRINPFRGYISTTARESLAMSIYFGIYHDLIDRHWNPFLAGSFTGVMTWLITYPIDVIKTRIQSDSKITHYQALKQQNLWKGLNICLLRALIVNGVSFSIYDYISNS
jgi:solute carrier family 25 (mitochondrial carnitine/acylcarnitine transporter), member 20/29